jgi:hypothetical protein
MYIIDRSPRSPILAEVDSMGVGGFLVVQIEKHSKIPSSSIKQSIDPLSHPFSLLFVLIRQAQVRGRADPGQVPRPRPGHLREGRPVRHPRH